MKMDGLRDYARQTLQQYANGATLHGMRLQQSTAKDAVAAVTGGDSATGSAQMSPNMVYMQNLTAIVLLTIESLQQRGLVPPRRDLVKLMRARLGMASVKHREAGCALPSSISVKDDSATAWQC
jgi:hypothetical protein